MKKPSGTLEVHEHWQIGERQNRDIEHSHEGGERPHRHQHCGPARYTIDKDDLARTTGGKGGGRKRYTVAPTGPQMPNIASTPEETTFRVIFVDEYTDGHRAAGISPDNFAAMRADFANVAAAAYDYANDPPAVGRLRLEFKHTPIYEIARPGDGEGGQP